MIKLEARRRKVTVTRVIADAVALRWAASIRRGWCVAGDGSGGGADEAAAGAGESEGSAEGACAFVESRRCRCRANPGHDHSGDQIVEHSVFDVPGGDTTTSMLKSPALPVAAQPGTTLEETMTMMLTAPSGASVPPDLPCITRARSPVLVAAAKCEELPSPGWRTAELLTHGLSHFCGSARPGGRREGCHPPVGGRSAVRPQVEELFHSARFAGTRIARACSRGVARIGSSVSIRPARRAGAWWRRRATSICGKGCRRKRRQRVGRRRHTSGCWSWRGCMWSRKPEERRAESGEPKELAGEPPAVLPNPVLPPDVPAPAPAPTLEPPDDVALIRQAIELIHREKSASINSLRAGLRLGYARALRVMEGLERWGVVGPAVAGEKFRAVLNLPSSAEATEGGRRRARRRMSGALNLVVAIQQRRPSRQVRHPVPHS